MFNEGLQGIHAVISAEIASRFSPTASRSELLQFLPNNHVRSIDSRDQYLHLQLTQISIHQLLLPSLVLSWTAAPSFAHRAPFSIFQQHGLKLFETSPFEYPTRFLKVGIYNIP